MLASRCAPKFKATLGPAVKNVFVPRWLKLKTVAPETRSSAVTIPATLSFLPREARFRCFCLSVNGICPRPAFGPSLILILTRRHQPLSGLWHRVRFSSVVQPKASLAGLPLRFVSKRTLDALKFGVLLKGSFGVDMLFDEVFHVLGCESFLSPPLCALLRSVCPSTGTLIPGYSAAPAGLRPDPRSFQSCSVCMSKQTTQWNNLHQQW